MSLTARLQTDFLFFVAKKLLKVRVPETITGVGARSQVGSWCQSRGYRKALLVTDASILKLGIAEKVLESLQKANLESVIYDQVLPNPTLSMGAAAAQLGKQSQVDVVIALGGGSVIDCAKLASAAITNPGDPRKLLGKLKVKVDPLPIVAIPTTAGTGSEVTVGSVITDDQSQTKIIMVSPKIVPSLVILDAETMLGLPPAWTAGTAFDALTHACEAYISRINDAEGKTNAADAAALIMKHLPTAVRDGSNIEARSALAQAAYKAGLAVNKCSLGYAHAIGNRLTDHYDVPHSVAVGMMLPHVLEYNLDVSEKRIAQLAVRCGLGTASQPSRELALRFIQAIRDLAKEVNLPTECEKLDRNDYPVMITQAFQVANATYPVPRYMTRSEAAAMLDKVAPKGNAAGIAMVNSPGAYTLKTIFITGASSGTGKATAKLFHEKGWNVVATMRNTDDGKDLPRDHRLLILPVDVTDETSVTNAVDAATKAFGKIDVLLNNAGHGMFGPLEASSNDQVRAMFEVNYFGALTCMRAVLPQFKKRREGIIINISSVGGFVALPMVGLYNSTKFALEAVTEGLWYDLKDFGVRVKLIEPGGVRTDFFGRSLVELDVNRAPEYRSYFDRIRKRFKGDATIATFIPPADLAQTIYKAATDESNRLRYLHGPIAKKLWFARRLFGYRFQMNRLKAAYKS